MRSFIRPDFKSVCHRMMVAGLLLTAISQGQSEPGNTAKEGEAATALSQNELLDRLKTQVAEAQARRDLAFEKFSKLTEKHKEMDVSIATLTKEIEKKELELKFRNGVVPDGSKVAQRVELPAKFVASVTPKVVVIEGDGGSGTGFICQSEGKVWVYTAAHVLSGNRKITVRDSSGRTFREFDFLECAEGVDIVRLKPKDSDLQGLELVSIEEAPKIGDVIVAIGNSRGTGSLSGEPGRVLYIEEKMWEVDAEIIPGNSGGPVVSLDTSKVVGIVTHLTISRGEGTDDRAHQPEIKRFAARLDKKLEWRRMPVTRFVKEWEYIEKMSRDSSVAWAVIYMMPTRSSARNDKLNSIAESIVAEEREHIQVQRVDSWLKRYREANKVQKAELIQEGNEIISRILEEIKLNGTEPAASDFSWFHRQTFEFEQNWRNKARPPSP